MVRLGDQQVVSLNAELLGITQIQRMFGIDESAHATVLLCFSDNVQSQRRLPRRFRAVNFNDAAARHTTDAERDIETERAR